MWTPEQEKKFLSTTNAVIYAVISCAECSYYYESVFKKRNPRLCPICGGILNSSTPQGRNSSISSYAENFLLKLIQGILKNHGLHDMKVKRSVICDELDLNSSSSADLAIVDSTVVGRVARADQIRMIIEVKMSLIWNWETEKETSDKRNKFSIVADYDRHIGRPSIYRTDSILKAIGKAAILRSHLESASIPYLVVGNCPPPYGYSNKIDGSVKTGIVQRFISVTPKPLVVDPDDEEGRRDPKETADQGYLRIDSEKELAILIKEYLENERLFIAGMLKKKEFGKLITELDLEQEHAKIAEQLFQNIYRKHS